MANHKSAIKRIRQTETRTARNKFYAKTMRNAIRVLRGTEKKSDAEKLLPSTIALVDSVAKRNIIHNNKAANIKSNLTKHVAAL